MNAVSWIPFVWMFLSTLIGVAVGLGIFRAQHNYMREVVKLLQEGGPNRTPIYMSKLDCTELRNMCVLARCDEITKLQKVVVEVVQDVRSLKNWAVYAMTKENMPLQEIAAVFEHGDRRKVIS